MTPEERRLTVEIGRWVARTQIAEAKLSDIARLLDEAVERNTRFYAEEFPGREVSNTQIYVHQIRKVVDK